MHHFCHLSSDLCHLSSVKVREHFELNRNAVSGQKMTV